MRRGKRGYSSKPMSKQILRDSLAVRRLLEVNPSELKDDVIAINRVTKVVKGGKNLSFSALVVVGDSHGHAGFGMGKAREVPMAIKKGIEQAKKNLIKMNLKGSTIPHQVLGRYGSAQVLLKPASEGTGVIAGGPVRKVMQVAGITNVLTKSIGTSNPHNVVKATFAEIASGGGAPGHAGGARHDSQGAAPRGSGGVGPWRKKLQAVRASAASASRRLRHRKSAACSRSRICIRRRVRASARSASAAASAPNWAKLRAPATRGRNPGAAIRVAADLKAARCRCTAVSRSAVFTTRFASRIRS